MTTSVTIKNNGPYRVNVNEVESVLPPREGKQRTINSHTLAVGAEITVIWSNQHYLCVIETNDADTPEETLRAVGAGSTDSPDGQKPDKPGYFYRV